MGDILKSLNIDLTVLAMNAGLFLLLWFLMAQIFWKPIMRHLEQRRHDVADAYKQVEDTRHEMERLRSEYQSRLATLEAEARGRIQQTVRDAQAQRERMLAEARTEADRIQQEGAQRLAQEKEETLHNMRETLDDVALAALVKTTGLTGDAAQRRLVDEYVAEHVLKS